MRFRAEYFLGLVLMLRSTTCMSFSNSALGLKEDLLPPNEFMIPEGELLLKHKFSIEFSPASTAKTADMNKMNILADGEHFSCYYPYY